MMEFCILQFFNLELLPILTFGPIVQFSPMEQFSPIMHGPSSFELLESLENLDQWPNKVKVIQTNRIGKSFGSEAW